MGLQNKCIYEISSKSNNGKVVKYTGKISQGGGNLGGEFRKKKLQISIHIRKWSNLGGKFSGGEFHRGGGGNKKYENLQNAITK